MKISQDLFERLRAFLALHAEDLNYGTFIGGDPRDFTPDPESSTEGERALHKAACEAWERVERPEPPTRTCLVPVVKDEEKAEPVRRWGPFLISLRPGFKLPHGEESWVAESVLWPRRQALEVGADAASAKEAAIKSLKTQILDYLATATDDEIRAGRAIERRYLIIDPPPEEVAREPEPVGFGLGTNRIIDEEAAGLLAELEVIAKKGDTGS